MVGEVEGRHCVLIDDMIDTAGTICAAAELLAEAGRGGDLGHGHPRRALGPGHRPPEEVADLAGGGDRHAAVAEDRTFDKLEVLSVAKIIADAIDAVFEDTSVSEIFGGDNLA